LKITDYRNLVGRYAVSTAPTFGDACCLLLHGLVVHPEHGGNALLQKRR